MNSARRSISTGLAAGAIALLFACTSSSTSGPGQLEVRLTGVEDSAVAQATAVAQTTALGQNPAVDQIVVNVARVTAHSRSAGWVTVGPVVSPTPVNLLDLQSSAVALGLVNLPAGKITQIRLILAPDGNYVVPAGSTTHEPLIVPSGLRSGIKLLGPWEVPDCTRRTVTIEFDGRHSLEYHQACGGATWILRPVIRLKHDASTGISCEPEPAPQPPAPECSAEVACGMGQACDAGVCVDATPQPIGSACTDASGCLTATCNDGVCAPGGADAPCQSFRDCASSLCLEGACAPAP